MPGELWRSFTQIAKESSYGSGSQPATLKTYYVDPKFTLVRQPRPHAYAVNRRDNVLAETVGPQEVAGTLMQSLSADEIVEFLLCGLAGGVTPTNPSAGVYLWTFKPSSTSSPFDSLACEWQDGANPWLVSGVYADKLQFKGSANGAADVTATVFGKAIAATTMTGALTDRTPTLIEGWESTFYVDAFGGTPGTTEVDGFLINWDVTISNNLARKYAASNSNSLYHAVPGVVGVEATLTFEAAAAQALTEFGDFNVALATPTYRLIRLSFGNNQTIASTYKRFVTIDMPGAWSAFALDQADAGTRTYQLKLSMVYDPTNTFGVQVRAQNSRSAAWA